MRGAFPDLSDFLGVAAILSMGRYGPDVRVATWLWCALGGFGGFVDMGLVVSSG